MTVDRKFLNEFNNWFPADLIAYGDDRRMTRHAEGVGDAAAEWPHSALIRAQLDAILEEWNPAYVDPFSEKTHLDWLAEPGTDALLRRLLISIRTRLPELER